MPELLLPTLAALGTLAAFAKSRDVVSFSLVIALTASFFAPIIRAWPEMLGTVAIIDAALVVMMLLFWSAKKNMRAWSIAAIGFCKVTATLSYISAETYRENMVDYSIYMIAIYALYFLQIATAGGLVDAIGIRLDNLLLRLAPKRHSILHNGRA